MPKDISKHMADLSWGLALVVNSRLTFSSKRDTELREFKKEMVCNLWCSPAHLTI